MKCFRGLEGPARLFVVLACCGAVADLLSLVTGVRRYVYDDAAWMPGDTAQVAFLLATAVSYLVWFHRAYTNLPRSGVPDPFVPARLQDDLWHATDPDLPWPAARAPGAAQPVPVTHLLRWPAAIAGTIAGIVPGGVLVPAAADLLRVVAAALSVPIVLVVTAGRRARAYRAPWAAPQ